MTIILGGDSSNKTFSPKKTRCQKSVLFPQFRIFLGPPRCRVRQNGDSTGESRTKLCFLCFLIAKYVFFVLLVFIKFFCFFCFFFVFFYYSLCILVYFILFYYFYYFCSFYCFSMHNYSYLSRIYVNMNIIQVRFFIYTCGTNFKISGGVTAPQWL